MWWGTFSSCVSAMYIGHAAATDKLARPPGFMQGKRYMSQICIYVARWETLVALDQPANPSLVAQANPRP